MRINSLYLENFRNFFQEKIDLSGDIVAIYGRNGVGKTAIFDALEFALLGSIDRFQNELKPNQHLKNIFSDTDLKVQVEFNDGANDWINTNQDCIINSSGGYKTRKELLFNLLVNEQYLPPKRITETAEELFRSALLLSQDTMRRFIDGDSEDRAKILAIIGGSATFQRCLDKAQDVIKEIKKREKTEQLKLNELESSKSELKKNVAEKEAQIRTFYELLGNENVTYQEVIDSLKNANIVFQSALLDGLENIEIFTASTQSACDERINYLTSINQILSELESIAPQHSDRIDKRNQLLEIIETAKKEQSELSVSENNIIPHSNKLDTDLMELNKITTSKSRRYNSFIQIPEIQSQRSQLFINKEEKANKIKQLEERLNKAKESYEKYQIEINGIKVGIEKNNLEKHERQLLLEKLKSLRESYPKYITAKCQLEQTNLQVPQLSTEKSLLEDKKNELIQRQYKTNLRITELKSNIDKMQKDSQEREGLIIRLKQFAINNECPLCGHIHPSKEDLQNSITLKVQSISPEINEVNTEIQKLSNELVEINNEHFDINNKIYSKNEEILHAKEIIQENSLFVNNIESEAKSLNSVLIEEVVNNLINQCNLDLETVQKSLLNAELENKKFETLILEVTAEIRLHENQLSMENKDFHDIQHQINELEQRIIDIGVYNDINLSAEQVGSEIESLTLQMSESELQKSFLIASKVGLQGELDLLHEKYSQLTSNLANWEQMVSELTTLIEDFRYKCKKAELNPDVSIEQIAILRQSLSTEHEKLNLASKTIRKFEWLNKIKYFNTEKESLINTLNDLETSIEQTNIILEKLHEGTKTSECWINSLSININQAVIERIQMHQPQILRLFKAMIPCPYIFDNINLNYKDNSLELGLRYKDQIQDAGEPKFFLSTAQANVLALSIFLSLASQQNWSKLNTILLDDPVQHLDDLDAVAFLDNLRSMALGNLGPKKQIIISTCDKNLYLLMIKKFNLPGLRFIGISLTDKGSAAPKIHYDVGDFQEQKLA